MTDTVYNPQVFFASERTALAWQRSSIAFIALGFVIERFGLFLKFLKISQNFDAGDFQTSMIIGVIFILIGSTICLLSSIQHQLFTSTLSREEIPRRHFIYLAPAMGYAIFLASACLAYWLINSSKTVP